MLDAGDILRQKTPDGILDRSMFHDNVHPTLRAFFLLGIAATEALDAEPFASRWGVPAERPPSGFHESLAAAGMNRDDLALAYRRIAHGVRWMIRWRFDSTQREQRADEFERWSRQLQSGEIQPGDSGTELLSSNSIGHDQTDKSEGH